MTSMTSTGSGYIFHRTREQPAPDPHSPPLTQIKFYLDRYKIKEALRIFFHEDTLKLLRDEPDFMWDVIPLICHRLRGLCQYRFRVFEGCERMLCRIAIDENCNPKEVLISLLAEISQPSIATNKSPEGSNGQNESGQAVAATTAADEDDNIFRAMIRPLEGTLLRMNDPTPRGENYRWVLKVLMRHIDNISLPQDYNLDGKKRLSLPNDPSAKRFIEVLPLVLSFIEDFSDFKPAGGSDFDIKAPMPILTKSQIDEVLNGESVTGDDTDNDEQADGNVGNLQISDDYVDFAFGTSESNNNNINNNNNTIDNTTKESMTNSDQSDRPDAKCRRDRDIDFDFDVGHPNGGDEGEDDDLANFYDDSPPSRGDITDASVTALVSLIQRPMTFLDLTNYCSDLRICANRCLNILLEQVPSLFAPIYKRILNTNIFTSQPKCDYNDLTLSASDEGYLLDEINNLKSPSRTGSAHHHHTTISTLLLATCSYIFRCERADTCPSVMAQSFPQILTHQTLLFCYMPYIIALLERSEILAHEKGLLLLESILSSIERDSLDSRYLDLFERSTLFKNLFQIMVYSHMCTNRRRAYDLFTNLCDLLTYECKIKVFRSILAKTDHRPCVRAACIDQYRKHLTIVHKELVNLNQQLSFVQTLANSSSMQMDSSSATKDDKITNQSQATSCEPNLSDDSTNDDKTDDKIVGKACNIESDNTIQPILEMCSNHTDCKLSQEERVTEINNNILRRMTIWQMRYKLIGGKTLVDFLDQCIKACLLESHCTDLVIENYELLLATLTIFRYLKLRKTVVNDEIEEKYLATKRMKETFFEPVRGAIAMIMTELKLHREEIVSKYKTTSTATDAISDVSASKSATIAAQGELDCINWVMCRLDLVESVLARTCDLYKM